MLQRYWALAALLLTAAAFVPRPAQAAISASCADLRNKIVKMENEVPSGAALSVDLQMRRIYTEDCLRHPSDGQTPGSAASDPWFDAKGDPASGPPPDGTGVYQTTQQIAGYCQGTSDPELCALMLNMGEGRMLKEGGDPKDPIDYTVDPSRDIDPADALPPLQLSAGGRKFPIDDACVPDLANLLFANGLRGAINTGLRGSSKCTDELNAIQPALGALQDAMAQWYAAALNDPTTPANSKYGLPGFREMCRQAFDNQNTCLKRQQNMSTAGTGPQLSQKGQAGSFGACTDLYGSVVRMCQQAGVKFPEPPRQASTQRRPTKLKKNPPPEQTAAVPMSDQCRGELDNFLQAGQAQDAAKAASSYATLKQDCPDVVSKLAQQAGVTPPAATASSAGSSLPSDSSGTSASPSLPEGVLARPGGSGALSNDVFARCSQIPAPPECTNAPRNDYAGPVYDPAQVLGFAAGIMGDLAQAGALAAGTAAAFQAPGYRGSNMNSLAGPIIRNGVGQGAPTARAPSPPRTYQSCGAGPVCSAK